MTWRVGSRPSSRRSTLDYGDYTVCKCGPWSQGPAMLQQLALMKQFNLGRIDPTEAGFIHHAGRVLEARLCRPRQILRRPGFRRGADHDAVVRRLQRRAQEARRRARFARAAAGHDSRLRQGACAARGGRRAHASQPARASRRSARSGRTTRASSRSRMPSSTPPALCAATRCISTSSTKPATWCRRRRPAAGCNPRRRSLSSASAWARARSSSGSTRAIRRRWRRANARARR